MIKPGTKGYGIIPWVMGGRGCGLNCGENHPIFETTMGEPYVAPAFVTWESPLDTSEEPRPDVEETYDENLLGDGYRVEELTMPLILVTRSIYIDQNDPITPDSQGFDDHMLSRDSNGLPVYYETLLVPAWSVTPIDGQYWRAWSKESRNYWDSEFSWLPLYSQIMTGASEEFDLHLPECFGVTTQEEYEDLDWRDAESRYQCVCGHSDAEKQMRIDHNTKAFDDGIEQHRSLWEETYNYAQDRWRQGWKLCTQHALDQDDPSTEMGFTFSPFWVHHALKKASSKSQLKEFASRQSYEFCNALPRDSKVG